MRYSQALSRFLVFTGLLVWCFLSGCAGPAPLPPPGAPRASLEEQRAVIQEVQACTGPKVIMLDDSISDAHTIAHALVAACLPQYQALGQLGGRSLTPKARAIYLQGLDPFYRELALQEVLWYRHWQRTQHPTHRE
jgi:hypothetical protein